MSLSIAQAWQEQADPLARREAIAKGYAKRGVTASSGGILTPGHAEAEQFQRPYESAGHASESPQAGPPRMSPVRHDAPGMVTELAMPGAPPPMASVMLPENAAVMPVLRRLTVREVLNDD